MTTFDKREEAFERQFVHDEGVRFKALARRNKRLGLQSLIFSTYQSRTSCSE